MLTINKQLKFMTNRKFSISLSSTFLIYIMQIFIIICIWLYTCISQLVWYARACTACDRFLNGDRLLVKRFNVTGVYTVSFTVNIQEISQYLKLSTLPVKLPIDQIMHTLSDVFNEARARTRFLTFCADMNLETSATFPKKSQYAIRLHN
jgi:hypothetical protein